MGFFSNGFAFLFCSGFDFLAVWFCSGCVLRYGFGVMSLCSDKEKGKEKEADKKGEIEKEKLKSIEGTTLEALLQWLPGCVSRDLIDQLTVIISLFLWALFFYYQF
jgi:hypothetical protein